MHHRIKQAISSQSTTLWIWYRDVRFGSCQHQQWLWSWPWWWCWWYDNWCTQLNSVRSTTWILWRGSQGLDGRRLYHGRTHGLSDPTSQTIKGPRSARRPTLYVQANQDSKTYAMILRQVIQNQRNYGAWDAESCPSKPTYRPKIYTCCLTRPDTSFNE